MKKLHQSARSVILWWKCRVRSMWLSSASPPTAIAMVKCRSLGPALGWVIRGGRGNKLMTRVSMRTLYTGSIWWQQWCCWQRRKWIARIWGQNKDSGGGKSGHSPTQLTNASMLRLLAVRVSRAQRRRWKKRKLCTRCLITMHLYHQAMTIIFNYSM